MKTIKYLNIFLIIIILTNCGRERSPEEYDKRFGYIKKFGVDKIPEIRTNENEVKTIVIPKDSDKHSIRIDTVFSSLKFVQLETNKKCLIGKIDELFFVDGKIIVVDKYGQKKAFIFTSDGKFVAMVGEKGRGPSEYANLSSIAIDHKNNQILLFDGQLKKIFFYDTKGNLVKEGSIYSYSSEVAILNDNHYLMKQYINNNPHIPDMQEYQLVIADSSQRIVGKLFSNRFPKRSSGLFGSNLLDFNVAATGNRVLFNPRYTNSIYEISGINNVKLKYQIEIGEKDILNNLENYRTNQDVFDAHNIKRLWKFTGLALEAGNYLYFVVSNASDDGKTGSGYFFYNNVTDKLIYGNSVAYTMTYKKSEEERKRNLLPEFSKFIGHKLILPISSNGSDFVSVIYPHSLFSYSTEEETVKGFRDLQNPVHLEDNPILIFFAIKIK